MKRARTVLASITSIAFLPSPCYTRTKLHVWICTPFVSSIGRMRRDATKHVFGRTLRVYCRINLKHACSLKEGTRTNTGGRAAAFNRQPLHAICCWLNVSDRHETHGKVLLHRAQPDLLCLKVRLLAELRIYDRRRTPSFLPILQTQVLRYYYAMQAVAVASNSISQTC